MLLGPSTVKLWFQQTKLYTLQVYSQSFRSMSEEDYFNFVARTGSVWFVTDAKSVLIPRLL